MTQLADRTIGVRLSTVLSRSRFHGSREILCTACCSDARQCQPGDLFIALTGPDGDGHDDVKLAIKKGATAVLAERLLPVSVPLCIVEDSREAYGQVCQALAGHPGRQLHMTGVSGTHGKTVTAQLIRSVLAASGAHSGILSSLGYDDGRQQAIPRAASPPAPELATWLARMAANGCQSAVLEVSSEALSQRYLSGLPLDAAVLTNVRRDHLELHGSLANYRRIKRRLLEQLKPDGVAVVNADDSASKYVWDKLDRPVVTVGLRGEADIRGQVIERHPSEQTFLLLAGNETVPVRTRMIGDQHVYRCLLAAAWGLVQGIELDAVVRGLELVESVPGQLERIECGQPFGVYVHHAPNPDTLALGLHALRQSTSGRVFCLFSTHDRGDSRQRPMFGRVAERGAAVRVFCGDHYGAQAASVRPIAHDVLDGCDRPGQVQIIPSRQQAIFWALEQAREGDAILLAGQSPRFAQDANVARHWLYKQAKTMQPWLTNVVRMPSFGNN